MLTPRALERRLKRHVLKKTHDFLAVCAPGFEAALLEEVQNLPNVTEVKRVHGGVDFQGPLETIYHANLGLSTAHRVLWRVADFLAQSYPMLYNKAQKLPWEHLLGFEKTVRFTVSARGSRLHHGAKITETLLSALQSTLEPLGLHPQRSEDAALNVHVRMFRDRCTLSLDTSGEHLHRRGYRTHVGDAPLRETLAAALLRTVDYKKHDLIVDPMCGSGTFLLEAARGLQNFAPGGARTFAFEHFPVFQPARWERLKLAAEAATHTTSVKLLGFDKDAQVLRAARENADRAGVAATVRLEVADALALAYEDLKHCGDDDAEGAYENPLLICNPPYGKRLDAANTQSLYAKLCAKLGASPGWTFALLTPDPAWVTLPYAKPLELRNGGLRVFLVVGRS